MFNTQQFQIPHRDFLYNQQHSIPAFNITRAFDPYNDLARCGSRNLSNALWSVRNTTRQTHLNILTHMLLNATEHNNTFPIVSGSFAKITHDTYNNYNTVLEALQSLNADISTRHYYLGNIQHTAQNPRMHVVYINSGMSILKTMLDREPNLERLTEVEHLITTYVRKNTVISRGLFNCYVVKDLFLYNNNYTENYTVFIDFVDEIVVEALVLAQILISKALIPQPDVIERNLNAIQEFITTEAQNTLFTTNEAFIVAYRTLLTKLCDIIMNIAQTDTHSEDVKITQYYNTAKPFLEAFYEILFKTYVDTSEDDFISKLCEAYNTITLGQDRETVKNNESTIQQYYEKIQILQTELTAARHRLNVAEPYTKDNLSELFKTMEVFKNIKIKEKNPDYLILQVESPLTFFDSGEAQILFKNTNSYLNEAIKYRASDKGLDQFALKSVFIDIFMRRTYTIHTFSDFKLKVNTNINHSYNPRPVEICSYNNNIRSNKNKIIAHPHIMRYNCWGQAQTAFYKAFGEKNFEAAFAQLVGATQNLTMSDSTVIKYFIEQLVYYWDLPTIKLAGPTSEDKWYSLKELYEKKIAEKKEGEENE